MKKEYDFSNAERGKFHQENLVLNLLVYLEPDNLRNIERIAKDKKSELSTIVNKHIKKTIKIAQVFR